jgi:hypothetical protein
VPDADPDYALLTAPNRLIVSSVPQRTVLIVIWAATDDDLEAWLPTAMTFVDSIHIAQ